MTCGAGFSTVRWMTSANDFAQELYASLATGGFEAVLPFFSEDVHIHHGGVRYAPEKSGHESLRVQYSRYTDTFRDFHTILEGVWENDGKVLAQLRIGGRGHSGADLWGVMFHVHTVVAGLSTQLEVFQNRDDAFAAAGLDVSIAAA